MVSSRSYRDLVAWERSMEFGAAVTRVVRTLESADRFVFDAQLRKAAWSVPANIAEGRERQYPREFLQHTYIGRGSLAEAETFLIAIERTCKVDQGLLRSCFDLGDEVGRLLNRLSVSLRAKSHPSP